MLCGVCLLNGKDEKAVTYVVGTATCREHVAVAAGIRNSATPPAAPFVERLVEMINAAAAKQRDAQQSA